MSEKQPSKQEQELVNYLKANFKNRKEISNKLGTGFYQGFFRNYPYILDEAFGVTFKTRWTLELCKQDAKNYSRRTEWVKNSGRGYRAAYHNKWLEECCEHMESRNWSLEECKKDALNYSTRNEWVKKSSSTYEAARKNKWLEECCEHMEKPKNKKRKIKCHQTKKVYESISATASELKLNYGNLYEHLSGKVKRVKNYTFEYIEDSND